MDYRDRIVVERLNRWRLLIAVLSIAAFVLAIVASGSALYLFVAAVLFLLALTIAVKKLEVSCVLTSASVEVDRVALMTSVTNDTAIDLRGEVRKDGVDFYPGSDPPTFSVRVRFKSANKIRIYTPMPAAGELSGKLTRTRVHAWNHVQARVEEFIAEAP